LLHPAVVDVAVFGVPDEEMGEAVKAVVQLAEPAAGGGSGGSVDSGGGGTRPTAEELVEYCKERLATYKCPRSIDFVDEMPRDPNGKLFKRLLKDKYWEGHASRIV